MLTPVAFSKTIARLGHSVCAALLGGFFSEGPNRIQVRWRVDGGGDSADDSILPSTTWQPVVISMQTIPGPGTLAFFGWGAAIACGLHMKLWSKA